MAISLDSTRRRCEKPIAYIDAIVRMRRQIYKMSPYVFFLFYINLLLRIYLNLLGSISKYLITNEISTNIGVTGFRGMKLCVVENVTRDTS